MLKKTKIICTIGPACNSEEKLEKLMLSGMNVARINMSHSDYKGFTPIVNRIKKVRSKISMPIAILLDTRGPEIRARLFKDGSAILERGKKITLEYGDFLGDDTKVAVTYENLHKDVSTGNTILLDDGAIELKVLKIEESRVICEVVVGGIIKNNKGINIPKVPLHMPILGEKDKKDIIEGIKLGIDFVAASFVRNGSDAKNIRAFLDEHGGEDVAIISKIENQQGLDALEEIIGYSDGIMVARGDLGVEMPKESIPLLQKSIISLCNKKGVPVITATQMLESMYSNPTPTRAELSDIANAIIDGTDVIMLSGETAAGKYPILAVSQMANCAMAVEKSLMPKPISRECTDDEISIAYAVSKSVCSTASDLNASAILSPTYGGSTAKMISSFRPKCPIIATTTCPIVQRKLQLHYGVISHLVDVVDSVDVLFYRTIQTATENNYVKPGDTVVVTAGVPLGGTSKTNLMKVIKIK